LKQRLLANLFPLAEAVVSAIYFYPKCYNYDENTDRTTGRLVILKSFSFFRRMLLLLCLGMVILLSWAPVFAQEGDSAHIELILDASGSMWAKLGKSTRIEVAKEALNKIIDDLSERKGIAVGLRVYGHRTNDCKDTKLEIPIGPLDVKKMKKFISGIKPKGKTPIAYSLEEAAGDFKTDFKGSRVVILVTDGLESCNGDPCAAAKALAEKGIVSKIHVVGFGMDKKSVSQLECIVKPSGGLLLEANSAAELAKAFDTIVKTALDVNLEVKGLDKKGNPAAMTVTVLKDGDELLSESGETVRQNVPEGSYLIRAVASGTGEEIFFEGVDLVSDELTSLKAVFSLSRIQVRGVDSSGKPINVSWEIFLKENREAPEKEFSGTDWKTEILAPGVYFVRASHQGTKAVQSFDLTLEEGDHVKKELSFAQGKLIINILDSAGKPLYADSWLYKSPYDRDNPEEAGRDGGENHEYTVLPGTYDVLVKDRNTKTEQWLKEIVLEPGKTVRKEVSFAQGKLVIKVLDSAGKPLYADSWLYKSPYDRDNPEEAGRDGGENHEYTVLPGTYDMLVKDPKTGTEQWLKEIVLEPGKTVRKEVSFAQGSVKLTGKGFSGKPAYFYVDAYTSPTGEEENPTLSESGEGEFSFTMAPGKYDLKVHIDLPPTVIWEREVEVSPGKTVSREFVFPAARTRFIPPQKDGERAYIYVDVFVHPADENDDLAASESGDEEYIQVFLAPGTYDFKIYDDDGNEVWFRGIELAADEAFSKEVKYEQ
jgi:general stress protein YciG